MNKMTRICLVLLILNFIFMLTACTTSWVSEAVNIINVLEPAIIAALSILTAFGLGISPAALAAVQKWSSEATSALQNTVLPLINQYNAATAAAQPGILQEIDAAITVIVNNLNTLLPTIHVTDPSTQAKITAIVDAILGELTALLNLVPVLKGEVTEHDEVKARVAALKSAKQFKSDFNKLTSSFGTQYQIK